MPFCRHIERGRTTLGHPNEERLRDLYAIFARGDIEGFLAGCTDDVTFTVPGNTPGSGSFTKDEFPDWIGGVIGQTGGSFKEDVLDVFANDDHGLLLLRHEFDRDGVHREYRTAHICELSDGLIAKWTEHPGSMREFEEAWGTR
jgi:ketosteroid isomerase-like protein